eukprot:5162830-Prymnesium_polylepis.1
MHKAHAQPPTRGPSGGRREPGAWVGCQGGEGGRGRAVGRGPAAAWRARSARPATARERASASSGRAL